MGVTLLDGGCFPEAIDSEKIAFEGLLQYQGKDGKWKERWFVLDSDRVALVKCATSSRQRSRSRGSVLGGDVFIKDIRSLSKHQAQPTNSDSHDGQQAPQLSSQPGFEATTQKGSQVCFRTKSIDEEKQWIAAVAKFSSGFTAAVGERLAERELLAGKFSLVRELGRGASGIVSLYTWQGKPFAIKKFVPQKAKGIPNRKIVPGAGRLLPQSVATASTREPSSIPDDIRREIALLKKASSLPYVIQLHDVILDPEHGNYYLVMEYMGGGAIANWDSERKCYVSSKHSKSISLLDEATVRRYSTHLLLGIQALHNNRLCHRDIKPENLMASEDKSMCKIGDLGVAHYFKEENGVLREEEDVDEIELWDVDNPEPSSSLTDDDGAKRRRGMLKSTKGTYQFLPPEALSGDEFDGFKADVWSIGVTMYTLSFGFLPFYSNDLLKLFEKIENDPLVFPTACQDDDLRDLLSSILEKNPEKRITIDGILSHRWLHRNVNSKALQNEVRALKRSASLTIADCDLGGAVSVLQSRFDAMSQALRRNSLDDMEACAMSTSQREIGLSEQYTPRPLDSQNCVLPKWFLQDTELIAAQLHYDWCHTKYLASWSYGGVRDDATRVHSCLMPMRSLPQAEQEKNVRCVVETMRCVVALGCHLSQPKQRHAFRHEPLTTEHITLSWEMMMLVDLLAQNSHEVWADGYVKNGWTRGDHFDATEKRHSSLKPYMTLDEQEKNLSREAVTSVLKACICLGYRVSCSRRKPTN